MAAGDTGSARRILVCGGAVMDCIARPSDRTSRGASHTSMPGEARISPGGVGRNIAEVIARLGATPGLLSVVGDDAAGRQLVASCRSLGMNVDSMISSQKHRTATCTIMLDGAGDLVGAVADMSVFDEAPWLSNAGNIFAESGLVICDANLPEEVLAEVLHRSSMTQVPVWFEPVSVAKAKKGRRSRPWHLVSPNWDELHVLLGSSLPQLPSSMHELPEFLLRALDKAISGRLAQNILLTMGPRGVVLMSALPSAKSASKPPPPPASREVDVAGLLEDAPDGIPPLAITVEEVHRKDRRCLWYRLPKPLDTVTDVTGAGDACLGGTACAFAAGWSLEEAVIAGMLCAHVTLFVEGAVAPFFHRSLLERLRSSRNSRL
eukprot:gnl/TRDRNA2_/TRDRNA2_166283_c0_seq1.p1 gnl/TRDRNA2_/TRDRNA2_166283_c0~~gnl/TRDRNA2_/TRDRNA2_166283_c0_seq1.p1  ORF type:complete len:377 (-),score=68.28 gnl/TRDRNA2_/TRDRNA2_166283_c0_seq1:42-1172(-)